MTQGADGTAQDTGTRQRLLGRGHRNTQSSNEVLTRSPEGKLGDLVNSHNHGQEGSAGARERECQATGPSS